MTLQQSRRLQSLLLGTLAWAIAILIFFPIFWHLTLPHLARPIAVVVMIETIFLLSVFAEIFTTTNGGPGYASTNLAYLIYNQALVQFDVGMASAGGLIAVVIANIAAIILVRMIGKNLTDKA